MLLLSYPHMKCVDVSTILFLAVSKSRIKHQLVQLQNVVCADHKMLIKGMKQVLMNFKLASMGTFCITGSNKHENKKIVHCHRMAQGFRTNNFTNNYTICKRVIKTLLFDWI